MWGGLWDSLICLHVAFDDNHENQVACMKLLMDRMLPISVCDKNADIKEKITNNISSVGIIE